MLHFGYPVISSLMITNLTGCAVSFAVAIWFASFASYTSANLKPLPNITDDVHLLTVFHRDEFKVHEISKLSLSCSVCLFLSGCAMLKLGLDDLLLLLHRGVFRRCPAFISSYRDRLELEYQYTLAISGCPWLVKDPEGVAPVKCQRTLMFKDPEKRRRVMRGEESSGTEESADEEEADFDNVGIEESSGFERSLASERSLVSATEVAFIERTN